MAALNLKKHLDRELSKHDIDNIDNKNRDKSALPKSDFLAPLKQKYIFVNQASFGNKE